MLFGKPTQSVRDKIISEFRAGYPADQVAATVDMLEKELYDMRKEDPVFDRLCKIAEAYGAKQRWDIVNSTAAGCVRAFQRQELKTWASGADRIPEKSIEDYIND